MKIKEMFDKLEKVNELQRFMCSSERIIIMKITEENNIVTHRVLEKNYKDFVIKLKQIYVKEFVNAILNYDFQSKHELAKIEYVLFGETCVDLPVIDFYIE